VLRKILVGGQHGAGGPRYRVIAEANDDINSVVGRRRAPRPRP